jgi:hypothetical protein
MTYLGLECAARNPISPPIPPESVAIEGDFEVTRVSLKKRKALALKEGIYAFVKSLPAGKRPVE